MKRYLIAGATALFLLPVSGASQSAYEQQVLGILSEVSKTALDNGYAQTGDKFVSALNVETAEDQFVELVAGRDYVFVAVCDQDCGDIDLHLYSPADEMLASDEEPDKVPVLEVASVSGGRHRLQVGMFVCASEPCYYAVGVYSRPGSAGPAGSSAGGAQGGGEAYVQQVRDLLESWSGGVKSQGFTATGDEWVSSLAAGDAESRTVTLGGGANYAVLAVCDQDCTDMNLAIFDGAGTQVDADVEADANPVLQVRDARAGQYRIEVRMSKCSSEPCYYAMGLFKQVGGVLVPVGTIPRTW